MEVLDLWPYVAVAVVTVIVYFVLFRKAGGKKKFQGNTILFVGNSGGGKTALFADVFHSAEPQTVNSIEAEVIKDCQIPSRSGNPNAKPFTAVCLPGNLRLRSLYKDHLPDTAGIVFVVDANNPDVKGTAALLHELLVNPIVDEQCPPILLALSKNDVAKRAAGYTDYFLQQLEDELEILKKSQNSGESARRVECGASSLWQKLALRPRARHVIH